jgi:hypothetical protein
VPGYWAEAHHAEQDWAEGGLTNIDELTWPAGPTTGWSNPAAGPENAKTAAPMDSPPHLDWGHLPLAGDGQARVNDYHHPENYLVEHNVDEQDD